MRWVMLVMVLIFSVSIISCSVDSNDHEIEIIEEGTVIIEDEVEAHNVAEEPLDPFDPNAQVQEIGQEVDVDFDEGVNSQVTQLTSYFISEAELLFTGGFADLTIIKLEDESYLAYLHIFRDDVDQIEDTARGSYAYSSVDGLEFEKLSEDKIFATGAPRAHWINDEKTIFHGWHPDDVDMGSNSEFGDLVYSTSSDGLNVNYQGAAVVAREGYSIISGSVIELSDGSYQIYFDEEPKISETVGSGEIWSAHSDDGINWERESSIAIEYDSVESAVTRIDDIKQILKPKVLFWEAQQQYVMFYNAHSEIFLATSFDGIVWEKQGAIGVHGADVDAIELSDGSLRLYYGDWSEETSGVVYTVVFDYLEEK